MIATDDQIRRELQRLAEALVPDDIPLPSSGIADRPQQARLDHGVVVDRFHSGSPRRWAVGAAAAVLLIAAGGVGLLLGTSRGSTLGTARSAQPATNGATTAVSPPWTEGVAMIVYVAPGADTAAVAAIHDVFAGASDIVDVDRLVYLDPQQALAEASAIFANDPGALALLNLDNIPTEFKVVPMPGRAGDLHSLADQLKVLAGVIRIRFADDPQPDETGSTTATPTTGVDVTHLAEPLSTSSSGDDVHRLQARLAELGFAISDADGQFGATTRQAVWAYETLVLNVPLDHATGVVTDDMWQTMQQPTTMITPRRPGPGTHVEIYLPQQALVVFRDDTPVFIAHASTGTETRRDSAGQWCATVIVDTDANGDPVDPPHAEDVCGIAYTPGGVFHITHAVAGHHVAVLGGMDNPVYFNYGIAVYGDKDVPLWPSTHGGIRIDQTLSETFLGLVHIDDMIDVWAQDGTPPENVTKADSTPVFSYPAQPQTYTVDAGDNVVSVAGKLGITVDDLVSINGWTDGVNHPLQAGERVVVPASVTIVPLLTGLTDVAATNKALEQGLDLTTTYQDVPAGSVNNGRVLAQTPNVNNPIARGTAVQIVVGRALQPTPTSDFHHL